MFRMYARSYTHLIPALDTIWKPILCCFLLRGIGEDSLAGVCGGLDGCRRAARHIDIAVPLLHKERDSNPNAYSAEQE